MPSENSPGMMAGAGARWRPLGPAGWTAVLAIYLPKKYRPETGAKVGGKLLVRAPRINLYPPAGFGLPASGSGRQPRITRTRGFSEGALIRADPCWSVAAKKLPAGARGLEAATRYQPCTAQTTRAATMITTTTTPTTAAPGSAEIRLPLRCIDHLCS